MGASGTKTKNSSHATTVQTPNVPGWLTSPYQNYATQAQEVGNRDPSSFTTPASVNQQQAFARAQAGTGNPTQAGYNATAGLQGYTPQQVNVGQLANTNLSPYMNPFQSQVIDQALSDIDRVRMGALTQNSADATRQGAWNGSRHGVVDAGTNDAALRTAASTSAGLRSQGYQQAQQAAFQDIMNRYNADAFNSQQGLAGQQYNLNAANQLANIGLMGANNTRADTQLMSDQGAIERGIAQDTNPNVAALSLAQAYGGLLGQIPSNLWTGQTQNQTASGQTSTSQGWLGMLGTMMGGMGNMMPSTNPFGSGGGGGGHG